MFKSANGKPKIVYRIPTVVKVPNLTDKTLWDLPRPEYLALDYPDMILSIIEFHKSVTYDRIKAILIDHNVPCDLGFILIATRELVRMNKIVESPKYTYAIVKIP